MPAKSSGGGAARNPYLIAGSLPWAQGGGDTFSYLSASDPEKALASHYASAYRSALDMNSANYNNILKGFQQTQAQQMGSQKGVSRGYKDLMNSVLGRISQVGRSDRQDLVDRYSQARGDAQQDLVDTGLSNSTVASSVARGLTYDEEKANLH